MTNLLRIGIDIGSTTIKTVIINHSNNIIYKTYRRHLSNIKEAFIHSLEDAKETIGEHKIAITLTGSGGMSLANKLKVNFIQEVIGSTKAIQKHNPSTDVVIELGGEDAKITYLKGGIEQRMNGTCAGGTGAFIDQMAGLLNTDASGLNDLAKNYHNIYPIAARCGVFAKTDIQPLINEGAKKEDIAISIFHAVVVQTISVLACGRPIRGNIAFLGGPLTFLSELRNRFIEVLDLEDNQVIFPNDSELYVALGAALSSNYDEHITFSYLLNELKFNDVKEVLNNNTLGALFKNEDDYNNFTIKHSKHKLPRKDFNTFKGKCFLGIDAGSTTTKAVVISEDKEILYSHYASNNGSPLNSAISILKDIYSLIPKDCAIVGSAVTGYGEHLLKEALSMDIGEIETIAHYKAAKHFCPDVDFILDIGGQDMKCLRIKNGAIQSITLNEACSAGCGSFLQAFAKSLKMDIKDFAKAATFAKHPVDLGSKCTVFMNSRVKQAQKEGFEISDIAAGLAYSVIKNSLYKVIKLRNEDDLGKNIVVQGGTFYNDAVLRSFEILSKRNVIRPDISGLMGAFGAAILAIENYKEDVDTTLINKEDLENIEIKMSTARCGKCSNNCLLTVNKFNNNKRFIAGNKCDEGLGINSKSSEIPNLYQYKYDRLFSYKSLDSKDAPKGTMGIPRVLNMYENYPFWHTLFTELGFSVILSDESTKSLYEKGLESISSETACYPAKIVHGHIENLVEKKVSNIFYPCIIHEIKEHENADNSFNCPVVTSYPEVIKNNVESIKENNINFLNPFLPYRNTKRLKSRLYEELKEFNFSKKEVYAAVDKATSEQESFKNDIKHKGEETIKYIEKNNIKGVLLGGRPYHVDPEINHGIPKLITSLGMAVFTEDSLSHLNEDKESLRVIDQWAYHSRLYASSNYIKNKNNIELVQLNSFGCGIDSITTEQVEEILSKNNKIYTNIKIDEGSNLGAARIRLRSLKAAVIEREKNPTNNYKDEVALDIDDLNKDYNPGKDATLLVPQFSPVHFAILEPIFKQYGFNVDVLDIEDEILDEGLKYVNNDVCYPAMVVIGQYIKALKSGKYDINNTKILLAQTEGQCRFTNYTSILEKSLQDAGFPKMDILTLSVAGNKKYNGLEGFTPEMVKKCIMAVIYGDLLTKVLLRVRPYETIKNSTNELYEKWINICKNSFNTGSKKVFSKNIQAIIKEFSEIPRTDTPKTKVGIVGELLVKLNPTANNYIVETLESEGVEVVCNDLLSMFLSSSYDNTFNHKYLDGTLGNRLLGILGLKLIEQYQNIYIEELKKSPIFYTPDTISEMAKKASEIISLGNQSGEGWKLPGEIIEMIEWGVSKIVCMQPFGCLPSHTVARGSIKELKRRYEGLNIVPIEYDPGSSYVNQLNRIKLMLQT